MLKSILVAADASPSSNRAIDLAAHLAGADGAKLHILYVIRDMQLPAELMQMAEVEKIASDRDGVMRFVADKVLGEARKRASQQGTDNVETAVGNGDPASVIIEHAEKSAADLVVMGTRGLGKVKSMLMGSVSRKVTNLCDVSCLIVR